MKINKALEILNLEKLPASKNDIEAAYKLRAKKLHPDVGGSEEAFQELSEAYEIALKALKVVFKAVEKDPKEEALKRKRDAMREEMLKRRAVEDYRRNVQATKGIYAILGVLGMILLIILMIKMLSY